MFRDPVLIVAVAGSLIVLVILAIGVGGFAKGGEFNRKYANKLMRLRIAAQGLAVLLILVVAWLKRG